MTGDGDSKRGRRKRGGPTGLALTIRGVPEWADWVRLLATRQKTTPTDLVCELLTERARAIRFGPRQPTRLPEDHVPGPRPRKAASRRGGPAPAPTPDGHQ